MLRTKADGTPDMDWRVGLDSAARTATLTPLGVILMGGFTRANGVPRAGIALVSLAAGAAPLDWSAAALFTDRVIAFDGQDNIYFTVLTGTVVTIRRVSLATSEIDAGWSISVDATDRRPSALGLDKAGGVWLFRDAQSFFAEPTVPSKVQRFNIADGKPTLITTITVSAVYPTARRLLSSAEHVYLGNSRYVISTGGQLDANWNPARTDTATSLQTIAGGYFYYTGYPSGAGGLSVRRAPLVGNGVEDASWSALPNEMIRCTSASIPLFVTPISNAPDAAEFVIRCSESVPSVISSRLVGNMAFATTDNKTTTDSTVIEYFNRVAGRYFITGRASEQAILDALPASFQRTGMRFAAKSGAYRDVPEQAVCRFYAAPENGGSNTHFYGTGDDCAALNTVRQVRFEGFDFAVIKPTGSACSATAPNAVTRPFNDKGATNEGNHRYVVSAATKARMLTQGWVDEGAVFCSANVVDAAN